MIKQFEQHTKQQLEELLNSTISRTKHQDGAYTIQQIMCFAGKCLRQYYCMQRIKQKLRKFTVNDDRAVPKDIALQILWQGQLDRRWYMKTIKKQIRWRQKISKRQETKEDCMQDVEQIQSQKGDDQLSVSIDLEQTTDLLKQQPSNLPPVQPIPPSSSNLSSQQTQEMLSILQKVYLPRDLQQFEYEFNRIFGINAEIQIKEFKRRFLYWIYPGYQLGLINEMYYQITSAFKKINITSGFQIISKIEQYKLEYFKFVADLIYFTEKLFMIYDKNQNEQIDLCELEEFYRHNQSNLRHLRVFSAKRIMNSFDINRSGKLEKGQVLLSLIQLRRRGYTLNKLW